MNKKNNIDKIKKEVARLILEIVEGKINAKNALESWPLIGKEKDSCLDLAWHEVYHFYADEDVRDKDKQYAQHQIKKLEKIAQELEENSDSDERQE